MDILKKMEIPRILTGLLLSLVIVFIGIFFMSKKENLDLDEIGTYGLANNTYQLQVTDWKTYSGMDLLLDYTTVKTGHEFDINNLLSNQTRDTHPPLHYIILNCICSIRHGTFSIWYGLIINLFFMVILFWQMRYLLTLMTKDNIMSTLLAIASFFTYGFINEIVFIRMYTMLSAISLMFIILIVNEMKGESSNNRIDLIFLLKFLIVCILGILTQYQFAFVALFFSAVFGIYLMIKKNFKMLLSTIFVGILSIALSILLFPGMINHIFGKDAIHSVNLEISNSTISERLIKYFSTIYQAFFGKGIIIYILFLLIGIILYFVSNKKEKLKEIVSNNKWFFLFLLCSVYFFVAVLFTTRYAYARYLYIIYPLIFISISVPICQLYQHIKPALKYISVILVLIIAYTSQYKAPPSSLNIGDNSFYLFLNKNKDTKMFSLDRTKGEPTKYTAQSISFWKLHRPLYVFRNMESISYIDLSKFENNLDKPISYINNENRVFLVIYPEENDNALITKVAKNNGFNSVDPVYMSTYFHLYMLSK